MARRGFLDSKLSKMDWVTRASWSSVEWSLRKPAWFRFSFPARSSQCWR